MKVVTLCGRRVQGLRRKLNINQSRWCKWGLPILWHGDGGMQLNIQELQAIFRNKLPVKVIVLNNNSLGMISQFQDSYFDGKDQSIIWGYSAPQMEGT